MELFEEERALIISLQKVDAILKAAKYMNGDKQENNNNTNPRIYRLCRSEMRENITKINLSRLALSGQEPNNFKSTKSNERAAWRPPGVVSRGVLCRSYRERSKVTHSNSEDK
ncbi:unnamed protein product [Hymenolepis diminuta]|uniref:Uncharacterized protein n=1 Tax=Hymenolepis diminuta TaxID=6216 RepID=A0A564ZD66_HYMDI|nr:unnamed protein product [Hymenolepis diminuta]